MKNCSEIYRKFFVDGNFSENDDMTENSDSGFTEINQNGSSDISQHTNSKTASPEPDLKCDKLPEEIAEPAETKSLNSSLESRSASKSSVSNSESSSSDDDDSDDDDYDDSDGSKPRVLNWVSFIVADLSFELI